MSENEYGFYGPQSAENAALLLKAADDLGIDQGEVATIRNGFRVPVAILDKVAQDQTAEAGVNPADPTPDDPNASTETQFEVPKAEEVEEPAGNASRESWAAWADHLGVQYGDDDGRDAIKAAVKAHQGEENG